MDPALLKVLVCPETGAPLREMGGELWCRASGRAYPIEDGIPVLLIDRSRALSVEEKERLK